MIALGLLYACLKREGLIALPTMFDRKTTWLLLFLLIALGSSSAHAFFSVQNCVEDFFSESRESTGLNGPADRISSERNPYCRYETVPDNPEACCYNLLIRRFINSDPARDAWNWFAYAGGNPVSFVDPTGLTKTQAELNAIGNLESLGFDTNTRTEVRSSEWMRAIIPGQVAWDNALTDFSN